MRHVWIVLLLVCTLTPWLTGQGNKAEGPTKEKAQRTYRQALDYVHKRMYESALESFKKADKQDDGECHECQKQIIKYAMEFRDWKGAEAAGEEIVAQAKQPRDVAVAHYQLGIVFFRAGMDKHKDELFARSHEEMSKALAAVGNFPAAIFIDGQALGRLKQDAAAKEQFERFIKMSVPDDPRRQRAQRYIDEPDLARARMAPAFTVTTIDGQNISLDDLQGKVVLLDFWATWCVPCREALPHMREIAKKFQGQPLIILSVSLDSDEPKWKNFVTHNEMTWLQCRDGGFEGPIARLFGVHAIPHTFTIDADGVLQDERIGDAAIEGKLKKLIGRAGAMTTAEKPENRKTTE
jgi:thiol-disulfide isomerase/thioredoxin